MRLSAQWTDGDGIEHFNIHNAIVDGAATIVKCDILREFSLDQCKATTVLIDNSYFSTPPLTTHHFNVYTNASLRHYKLFPLIEDNFNMEP